MGCCQSKGVPKDADDRALDEVAFKTVGVSDVDNVFDTASNPINNVATINNSILDGQDAVKSAVLALSDKYYDVVLSASPVRAEVKEITETTSKSLSDTEVAAIADLAGPFKVLQGAIEKLNDVVEKAEDASVTVVNNRVKLENAKEGGANIVSECRSVNNALFATKKAALKVLGKDGMSFKDTLKEAVKQLKDGGCKPKIVPNMAKLAEGEIDFDVDLGKDGASGKVQKLWDSFVGKGGLVESIKEAVGASASIKDDLEAAKAAVEGLPKDLEGFKGMAEGINPMRLPGAFKAVANNAKLFGTAAKYMPTFLETVKGVCNDLKEAFTA